MPFVESLDELAEWLADRCGIFGNAKDPEDHPDDCPCRICFVIGIKQRMIDAVKREEE